MTVNNEESIVKDKVNDLLYLLVLGRQSNKWGFPKGHMEQNETEEQTALREVKEETGIELSFQDITSENRIRFKNNIYFLFHTTLPYIHERRSSNIDRREIECMKWFSEEDLLNMEPKDCNFGLSMFIKKVVVTKYMKEIIPSFSTTETTQEGVSVYPVEKMENIKEKEKSL
jgi:ADP-ribose pyrophosphatase YjhB (NUDIX family)